MNRTTRWILAAAVLGVMACNAPGLPAATVAPPDQATEARPISIPTTTPLIPTPAPTAAPTATPPPTAGCAKWFFVFRPGLADPGCPEPPITVDAVGEDFIGGRVYRYTPASGSADPRATVFVIYNNGAWETFVDTFTQGDPDTDPAIKPPSNRFQPTGAIGKVWRDNPAVRDRLGWAYGPEQPFTGRYQIAQDKSSNVYVDHGKGLVLKLVIIDQGSRTWKVVGDY